MSVKRIPIFTKKDLYFIEANPDNSGIRLVKVCPDGMLRFAATFVDCGTEFAFSKALKQGVHIETFNSTKKMKLKSGDTPSIEDPKQIEVNTPHGRKMIVRFLSEKPIGVIIGYYDGETIWSLALCRAHGEDITVYLSD